MSSVTGALVIWSPSCVRDERMNVASSGSTGDASVADIAFDAAVAAVSRSLRSAASLTISFAFTMSASRSCSASCMPLSVCSAEVSTLLSTPSVESH
jgi:hypothetical protein